MAPGLRPVGVNRGKDPQQFLLSTCFLLTIGIFMLFVHVRVAGAAPVRPSLELRSEQTTHGRRLLAVNLTQSLLEDGEALVRIKEAIISDPLNVTYWWKRQGTGKILNPCKMRNSTPNYWPGINCTNKRVTSINLSNMSLTGTLSPELGALTFLASLDLSNNLFTGPIPEELTSATALETVNLRNNRLDGALPSSLGNWTNLTSLDVANNGLVGGIPASIGNLQRLEALNVTNNNLTGAIPVELNLCKRLNQVDLSRNGLQGTVPFHNLSNLTVLHLQENQLEGDFVSTRLDTLPRLEDLDLSNNNLSGSIPATISRLPLRTQLSLGWNNLSGSIPDTIGELKLVQRMNLSANWFNGSLPGNISSCVSLRELDVSSNDLIGLLPGQSLASLPDLAYLNVSKNHFGGGLPLLGGLQSLRVFDAAFNSLGGSIPDNFVNFTSLTNLNVSYNELFGALPVFVEHDNVNRRSFVHDHVCGVMINKTCDPSSDNHKSNIISIAVGSAVAFALVFLVTFCCCSRYLRRGRDQKKFESVSTELEQKLTPEQVLRATQNFNEQNRISDGSMSNVYRGALPDGTLVAVKKLTRGKGDINESVGFEILSHIRHWSLVKVFGYCCSPEVTAVVMEYMPNGNLSDVMYPKKSDTDVVREFNWNHRFNTAVKVAEGLKYLHHECSTPTVHGDLKPSNILFNTFTEARISDFGIATILDDQKLSARPTLDDGSVNGYKAPESADLEGYTTQGDIYSFGIVMLEMISGRSPQSIEKGVRLPDWIRTTLSDSKALENILDPFLRNDLEANQQKISMALGVALLCAREQPQERPYITEVLKMLNHIKARPHDETKGSVRFKSSPSTHQRNKEIRQEVPGLEITPSSPTTPPTTTSPPHVLSVHPEDQGLSHTPSLSAWTPSPENR